MDDKPSPPNPTRVLDAIMAFQTTAVLRAGIEFGLFTAIGSERVSARELGERCQASERGVRILCDHLTMLGFLTKEEGGYGLSPDAAAFLDKRSPGYLGGAIDLFLHPMMGGAFQELTNAVRKGGTAASEQGTVSPENPVWVTFARAMMPIVAPGAESLASLLPLDPGRSVKVLDIAAGHGLYGIAVAKRLPKAEVVALDWPSVLDVAEENARAAGVVDRFRKLPGDAFEVPFGDGYDLVLIPNFLHHFDVATCERFLRKVHASLAPGGKVVTVEFVPNEDRVSPPAAARFSLTMLATTPSGDAYTFTELDGMLTRAGFSKSEARPLPMSTSTFIVSEK